MHLLKKTAGKRKLSSRPSEAVFRTPRWSKLVLPAYVVAELQRRGGARA
jgi:hypothetical protein